MNVSLGFIFDTNWIWVIVIVAIGVIILLGTFVNRSSENDWIKTCFDGD
ncbi:MAG: hypothetical protein ACFFCM_17315 [Promethearchaeota archaeon]